MIVEMAGNLESVKKIIQLPVVEAMLKSSSAVYEKIKNSNGVLNWALSLTESTAQKVLQVVGAVTPNPGPVTKKLDQVFVNGISFLEEKLPIVKKAPQHIYEEAKDYVSTKRQKLQNYKENFFSLAKNSVDQTRNEIVSLGGSATQSLRDAVQASEKFVGEKLKSEATALSTAVAAVPEQLLGAVGKLSGDITCTACLKEKPATSPTVPVLAAVPPPPTSGTQTSAVTKAA